MASSYPGGLDSFSTKVDNVDKVMAAHVNDMQNAIVAVQGELGLNPAGPSATVAALLESLVTGWVPEADTWVYVSATSFKIVGKNVTSRFPVGVKLKCTNGGTTKYFYGIGAVYSGGDTTVTITGGSDYSLASGAITENYYGYGDPLPGFPNSFSYTVTWTGSGSNPAIGNGSLIGDFRLVGAEFSLGINMVTGTTTTFGAGYWIFGLPFTIKTGKEYLGLVYARDITNVPNIGVVRAIGGNNNIETFIFDGNSNTSLSGTNPFTWSSNDRLRIKLNGIVN